jgi:molybdenum cofactor biosynthesis enzyme
MKTKNRGGIEIKLEIHLSSSTGCSMEATAAVVG